MTTTASAPATSGGSSRQGSDHDLVASAEQLQPLLREHSPAGDDAGELSSEVVDALHEHGLFGMWVPRSLGGAELDPLSSLRVIQALAEADPSTAWVVMAAGLATGTGGAYLADEAVAEMFGGERFPVVAGCLRSRNRPPRLRRFLSCQYHQQFWKSVLACSLGLRRRTRA